LTDSPTLAAPVAASSHLTGFLMLLGSAVAWSTAGLFVRAIPLDAMSMVAWRGPAAALGILAVIVWMERGRTWAAFAAMGAAAWAYAVLAGLDVLIYVASLKLTTVAHVAFIYATVPFAAAGLGFVFLGERPSRSALIACALALTGVGIMVATPDQGSSLIGDLMAAVITVMTAGMMVLSRRFPGIPMLPAACMSGFVAGVAALPLATQLPASPGELGLIAASGVINMSVGLGLLAVGARLLPAVETALIGTLEGPLAPLWVWLAFAETPGPQTLIGGALVIIAVLGHLWLSARTRAA
jgi:drug/metabolite transporter (DMT)-like permease